jgi:hypothetical protein
MVFLTVKEWETYASTNWDIAVVDDEAKCDIRYGENEKQSKFCRYKIYFTARWGELMKPFLLGLFEQNQLLCIVGRNVISGRWVELVWRGSYKSHDNRCTVLLLRRHTA